jgi:hypothetical protein
MRAFLNLLKQIITAGSGISSKRVCGLLGWLVLLACLGYATWNGTELPLVTPDFIFGTIVLLGVDSVTAIWKKGPKTSPEPEPPSEARPLRDQKHEPEPDRKGIAADDSGTTPAAENPEPGSLNNAQL